jgi:RNA 2',3'-cyclic 3'-phosphodiesterase
MKRLFSALKIQPDGDFLAKYRELKLQLHHEQIKWVEEHNIHVTLKFFGETEEEKIPGIFSVLEKRAGMTGCITLRLAELGIFGSSYAPKVIWAGIEPFAELSLLMKNIHSDLKTIGYEPDRQNLVPHLTLGRIKFLRDKILFKKILDQFRNIASSPMVIAEMILYESILRREGPEYIALERFPFIKKELP